MNKYSTGANRGSRFDLRVGLHLIIPLYQHEEHSTMKESSQQSYFRVTDSIPEQAWYWGAVASILASAALKAAKKNDWSIFVGQWPPTFLLFGLYHKLLRPSK